METLTNQTKSSVRERSAKAPALERTRVLLVEDDPMDARLIELMLFKADEGLFELETADRLSRALERIAKGGIGVVLCDLSLPDSSGLKTLLTLQARAPNLPIVVLSGYDDTKLAVQAVHEGAQDYLVKGQVDGQLLTRSMRYAIERKRMSEQLAKYAEELRTRNAQLEADFNMAREIQEIFLPEQYPSFPGWAGPEQSALRFYHRYLPAAAVGGDFFDVFPISNSAAGVFICDVMGHGMRAALVTAIMRGLVEELIPVAENPARFMCGVNRSLNAILRRTRDPFIATAFYGVIDLAAAELRFTNAGHPSPILVRRETGQMETLKQCDPRHGPALGLFVRPPFPTSSCPLHARDLLLLFTDGLYEAEDPEGREYGQERLLAAIQQRLQLPAPELLDAIINEVLSFCRARSFDDDVCLLAAEVLRTGI